MITLDRLKYFVEVANREHVLQAAKALSISPSVISSAILTLENELGHKLFFREKQRLKITEKGTLFLKEASRVLESAHGLYHCLDTKDLRLRGHFKLGASHFLMHEYLLPAIIKIQKNHPDATFELLSIDSGVAVSHLMNGILDAALVFRSSYFHDLEERILHQGHFKVAVKRSHPILKVSKKIALQRLNELPAITFRTSMGANFWETHPAFRSVGIIPKHSFFYDDTETAIQLLTQTDGWAFLPDVLIDRTTKIQSVELINEGAPVNVSLIRSKSRAQSTNYNVLMKLIEEKVKFKPDRYQ